MRPYKSVKSPVPANGTSSLLRKVRFSTIIYAKQQSRRPQIPGGGRVGPMTRIYLIRHAEAEGNLYRIAQGQHESNLTDRGRRQVKALERRFADVHIDAVYASDLYRTRATAAAVYKPKGLPLHRCPGLREICVGDWEGRTWGDIARRYPQEMADFGSRMDRKSEAKRS